MDLGPNVEDPSDLWRWSLLIFCILMVGGTATRELKPEVRGSATAMTLRPQAWHTKGEVFRNGYDSR